jgi:hypothetical protein
MIAYVPFLICIIGALVYAISNNGKAQALGKDMFWTGLLVTLLVLAGHTVKVM